MPRGVYPRTPNQLKAAVANLAKGRGREARKKAAKTLRRIAQDPEWRERVSQGTKAAMHRPEVRKKHLAGLKRALETHGPNFRGGNGQPLTKTIRRLSKVLKPLGFKREVAIKTRGHNTGLNPPYSYKADFANRKTKTVIEVDGPCHNTKEAKATDRKKQTVLEALGWTVLRISHK